MNTSELRQEIDRWIAADDVAGATRSLAELWAKDNSSPAASFLCSRYEQLRPTLNLPPYRLAILRSFTVEPMVPLLRAAAFSAGIDLTVRLSEFNTHAQEILDPASALYDFAPDAVILAVQTRDAAPDLWRDFPALTSEQIQAAIDRVTGEFRNWVHVFREHSQAHLIIHNFEQPIAVSQGVLDNQLQINQSSAIRQLMRGSAD